MNTIEVDDMRCICDACGKLSICTGIDSRIGVRPALLVFRCNECVNPRIDPIAIAKHDARDALLERRI